MATRETGGSKDIIIFISYSLSSPPAVRGCVQSNIHERGHGEPRSGKQYFRIHVYGKILLHQRIAEQTRHPIFNMAKAFLHKNRRHEELPQNGDPVYPKQSRQGGTTRRVSKIALPIFRLGEVTKVDVR